MLTTLVAITGVIAAFFLGHALGYRDGREETRARWRTHSGVRVRVQPGEDYWP
jgi:hypothetical protein